MVDGHRGEHRSGSIGSRRDARLSRSCQLPSARSTGPLDSSLREREREKPPRAVSVSMRLTPASHTRQRHVLGRCGKSEYRRCKATQSRSSRRRSTGSIGAMRRRDLGSSWRWATRTSGDAVSRALGWPTELPDPLGPTCDRVLQSDGPRRCPADGDRVVLFQGPPRTRAARSVRRSATAMHATWLANVISCVAVPMAYYELGCRTSLRSVVVDATQTVIRDCSHMFLRGSVRPVDPIIESEARFGLNCSRY